MKGFELFEYQIGGEWIPWEKLQKRRVRASEIRGVRVAYSNTVDKVASPRTNHESENGLVKIPDGFLIPPPQIIRTGRK